MSKIEVSLTQFVDYTVKTGDSRLNHVNTIKHQAEYDVAKDYYKQMREAIIEVHKQSGTKADLEKSLRSIADTKKENYAACITGYKKFWGKKAISWFQPPRSAWKHTLQGQKSTAIEIIANPEIGLEIGGVKHIVKLYFKSEPFSKKKAQIALCLLHYALHTECKNGETFSFLDVREGKLFSIDSSTPDLLALVQAEATGFAIMWDAL